MIVKVPYLTEQQIERETMVLLQDLARYRNVAIKLPIPIEDIVEKYLKLGVEFDDMHRFFRVPPPEPGCDSDILGAMFFEEKRIILDESLDPEAFPAKEGRYRFTLSHETAYWCLHRHLFAKVLGQGALFGGPATPSIICRSTQAKEPIEWQADCFASCLLMPRKLVFDTWYQEHGNDQPFVCKPRSEDEPEVGRVFDGIARDFAPLFGVSVQAMRIRLEKLGLLLREPLKQRVLEYRE